MATLTVTNLNDSGPGSLRAAITAANAGVPGALNTIKFTVSGTITLASDLPSITGPTAIIAASTTTGNAPTVGINFNGHSGLVFAAGSQGSQLIGLSLGGASGNGVTLNAGNITLNNNYIGLALNGSPLGNSGDGVFVAASSSGNDIGYNPTALSNVVSNVISANGGNGISFHGSTGNTVVSNRIGTDLTGTTAMANGANGIWVTAGSNGNLIGGTASFDSSTGVQNNPTGDEGKIVDPPIITPALGNLVSGNVQDGVRIDTGSQNDILSGNFIGTTVTGDTALGNGSDGVAINGADNNSLIGCTVTDNPFIYYNVVSGNGANGIHITNANNTTVQANFVGAGANNAVVVGNALDGILVDGSSQTTQVGGVIPLGNVISGNGVNGIEVKDTASGFTTFNTFGGVFAFQGAAPNGNDGILITSTGGNQVVRTNVIAGNVNNGLEIGGDASGVLVVPNIIGLNTRGDGIIANGGNGVLITGTAHDNTIGGPGGDQVSVIRQNTFSGNAGYGVAITGAAYNNTVTDSAIGTDIQETAALGNGAGGVLISSTGSGNIIGTAVTGSSPAPSPSVLVNIISGNNGNGVTLAAGAKGDAILNNWIGLNIAGAPTLPNTGAPIVANANYNLIYGNEATGALPVDSPTAQLQALYIGWFGWAADPGSFIDRMQTYLTDILNGDSVTAAALDLSVGFSTAPELAPYAELAALVPPVSSPTPHQILLANSFINQTYNNLFGHAADSGALLTWRTALFNGNVPFSAMVYDIANGATGSDVTALNSKIEAASYFTAAREHGPTGITAIQGVVDTTTALASEAATNADVGSSHTQVTYSSILSVSDITTGVRGGLDGTVVLTGGQGIAGTTDTQAYLYEGPLNNTTAGTKYLLTPTFSGETVTTSTLYGPDTSIFTPSLGIGNVRAVGSYQYSESPSGVFNHGMIYQGPVSGIGGTWTQIDVPSNGVNVTSGVLTGGAVADTILHSTMGGVVVGNYDLVGVPGSGNGFIYNMATQQYTLMQINGSLQNGTTLYGIWENGVGSTSYTIAGGTFVAGDGINEGFLESYNSSTGILSNLTFYTGFNLPGIITHFENITAVPGGYNLVATTTEGVAFASIARNPDGSYGSATWAPIDLPGSNLLTGNIVYQNVVGGIYNTTSAGGPATYLGVVDQSHVTPAGGLVMPMGSYNFAYALSVNGGVGDTISGSTTAGNVLGGSIGNDSFAGTQSATQSDTIYTGGGADAIMLVADHSAQDRVELYAGNGLGNAANLTPGGVVASVAGSIVNASDIPQLGWWGQATAQFGGPVSNATTNAGVGTGTSQDMSVVANFVTGSPAAPGDTIDISLGAFSNLLRNLGTGGAPGLGAAIFSNMVRPGGTVTVGNANVLLIDSPSGFANAAAVAAALIATPIHFAGSQTAPLNHYIIAYQDLGGNVRIADMDIHASSAFTTTAQGQTISISDMVQLSGVSLAFLQPANITFLSGSGAAVVSDGQTLFVYSGQTVDGTIVLSGGTLAIESGGVASNTTVFGRENVFSGGTARATSVGNGGVDVVSSDGVAIGTIVLSGGVDVVDVGGIASNTTVSAGGVDYVYGTGTSLTAASGGAVYVMFGGTVNGATVAAGGYMEVDSASVASGTMVLGRQDVLASGTARATSVGNGGVGVVSSGGVTSNTVVLSGGVDVVATGGSAGNTTVSASGIDYVYGTETGLTAASGAAVYVVMGGTINSSTVSAGGYVEVDSGSLASGTMVLGRQDIFASGTARATSVGNGGVGVVSSGGGASGTIVLSGGVEVVGTGGAASGTTVSSAGTDFVYGTETNLTVESGGEVYVISGGTINGATLDGGFVEMRSGGLVTGNPINFTSAGGYLQLDDSQHFNGVISGFHSGGIDLTDILYSAGNMTLAYDSGTGVVEVGNGLHTAQITLLGQYSQGNFNLHPDGNGGTLLTDPPLIDQYALTPHS